MLFYLLKSFKTDWALLHRADGQRPENEESNKGPDFMVQEPHGGHFNHALQFTDTCFDCGCYDQIRRQKVFVMWVHTVGGKKRDTSVKLLKTYLDRI